MNVGQVQEKYVGQNGHFHFIKCTYCSLLLILSLIVIVFGKKEGRGNFSKTFENVQCRFSISPTTFDILLAHTFDLFCIVFKIIYSLPNQKSLVKYLHGKYPIQQKMAGLFCIMLVTFCILPNQQTQNMNFLHFQLMRFFCCCKFAFYFEKNAFLCQDLVHCLSQFSF